MALAFNTPVPLPNSRCGASMFAQGYGTWQGKPDEVRDSVVLAIKAGYRLIDCARIYQNQSAVGDAITQCIKDGIVARKDLFIVSKVWNTDHSPEYVAASTRQTIADLKCDYLDLLLIHWPVSWVNKTKVEDIANQTEWFVTNENTGGAQLKDVPIIDTWRAMEQLVDEGLVKDIGVSNFTIEEVDALLTQCRYKPVVNQVEVHPGLPQEALHHYCESKGIKVMAYCPLGLGMGTNKSEGLIYEPEFEKIAKENGFKSAAALCLQWSSQKGFICLSKSVTPSRISENAATPFGGISEEVLKQVKAYGEAHPLRVCNPDSFKATKGPFFTSF